jgi:hypothetical protein
MLVRNIRVSSRRAFSTTTAGVFSGLNDSVVLIKQTSTSETSVAPPTTNLMAQDLNVMGFSHPVYNLHLTDPNETVDSRELKLDTFAIENVGVFMLDNSMPYHDQPFDVDEFLDNCIICPEVEGEIGKQI